MRKRLKIILPFVIKVELEPCNNLLIKVFFSVDLRTSFLCGSGSRLSGSGGLHSWIPLYAGSLFIQPNYLLQMINVIDGGGCCGGLSDDQ